MKLQIYHFTKPFLILTYLLVFSSCATHKIVVDHKTVEDQPFTNEMLSTLKLSSQMYERGELRQEPVTMAFAAELRAQALGSWHFKGNTTGGVLTPSEMLGASYSLASHDKLATAMIDRIRGRRSRGAMNGSKVEHATISVSHPFETKIIFEPNMPAVVYVEGEKGSIVNMLVTTKEREIICDKDKPILRKICHWENKNKYAYKITITTKSQSPIEVLIIIN